ncbi:retrotransposon protein [Cucumis melo var. makuwa]|uniref:Retrotransposon protein n=1 Tax=Cucumis melo var. makuwa TaxID=1194695 RepID=A0A5D3D8E2_CUCMM|nr:retrotransposon protein [Cucumis melo var. makuwa]
MRGPTDSGFGWNDDVKCIIAERDVLDHWVRMHPASGLLNKPFPHYDTLSYMFEKDRATGACAETFADIGENHCRMAEEIYEPRGRDGAQVIELIEVIPNLTMAEKSKCIVLVNQKVSLMRSFIKMSDSMKVAYCRILHGGDP